MLFRDYDNNSIVENLYMNMHKEQTYTKKKSLETILKYNKPLSIKDAIYYLNKVVD